MYLTNNVRHSVLKGYGTTPNRQLMTIRDRTNFQYTLSNVVSNIGYVRSKRTRSKRVVFEYVTS